MKIHLKGYYGFGNLGDDLLMISSISIINKLYNNSVIYIKSQNDYAKKLINAPNVVFVKDYNDIPNVDLLILGGGGLFFDFINGNNFYLNTLVKKFGLTSFNRIIKLLKSRNNQKIISWGIGVGPYKKSSNLFLRQMYFLSRFSFIGVRDKESYLICKKVNKNTYLYTDIVFESELWLRYFPSSSSINFNKILLVLRDWDFENVNFEKEFELAEKLIRMGFQIEFLSLNPQKDKNLIKKLEKKDYPFSVYQPENILDVISNMSNSGLIITQRAHGAIIGNVLGVPSICIGIEPKLKNVHEMVKNSSFFIPKDYNIDDLLSLIQKSNKIDELRVNCSLDNRNNRKKISEMLLKIKSF
jgi:polysaccharide pyruvyl transferase WcaK-like protein